MIETILLFISFVIAAALMWGGVLAVGALLGGPLPPVLNSWANIGASFDAVDAPPDRAGESRPVLTGAPKGRAVILNLDRN